MGPFDSHLKAEGPQWLPLRGGLTGGDDVRARAAVDDYAKSFAELKRHRF